MASKLPKRLKGKMVSSSPKESERKMGKKVLISFLQISAMGFDENRENEEVYLQLWLSKKLS